MNWVLYVLSAVFGYLIGGINPAIVLSKTIYHQDIRKLGSGNPGFTNFKRVYGNRWAWFVFVIDIGKAALVVGVFAGLFGKYLNMRQVGAAFTGLMTMIGHIYPIWYRFKGGKGFLVGATAVFFVDWRVGLIALAIMMLLLFTRKYMSLSVICAAISCPIMLAIFGADSTMVLVLTSISVLLMIWRHKENIKRLCNKTEPKFTLHG